MVGDDDSLSVYDWHGAHRSPHTTAQLYHVKAAMEAHEAKLREAREEVDGVSCCLGGKKGMDGSACVVGGRKEEGDGAACRPREEGGCGGRD